MDAPVELHFLVPRAGGGAVLVAKDDDGLPSASIDAPPNRPLIQSVASRLGEFIGASPPILETHVPAAGLAEGQTLPALVVTEAPPEAWRPRDSQAWRPVDGFRPRAPERIARRLALLLEELRAPATPPELRPRWSRPGWFARAATWTTDRLTELGRPPTGPIEQRYLRGISALLYAPTAGGAAYLKAVFPVFHHEPVVTRLLRERVGPVVPDVLAVDADEGWLLMDDLGTDTLSSGADDASSAAAIRTLVTIQRAFGGAEAELAGLGCPVRPLLDLPVAFARALDTTSRLELVAAPPSDPARLPWLERAVRRVEDLGLPTTLVHGDFHTLNVVRHGGRLVIYDWSDAAVSHPLVDVATWFAWIDEGVDRAAAWEEWLDGWSDLCDVARARPLLDLVTAVGAAYQVVSYVGILEGLEPDTRYAMAGGVSTFLNRLDAIVAAAPDAPPGARSNQADEPSGSGLGPAPVEIPLAVDLELD